MKDSIPVPSPLPSRLVKSAALAFAALALLLSGPAARADVADDLKQIQGKWEAEIVTDNATQKWVANFGQEKVQITVKSLTGEELGRVEARFKLVQHGPFRALTYWNIKPLTAQGEAQLTEEEARSAAYRFHGGNLYTAGEFDSRSDQEPNVEIWKRVGN